MRMKSTMWDVLLFDTNANGGNEGDVERERRVRTESRFESGLVRFSVMVQVRNCQFSISVEMGWSWGQERWAKWMGRKGKVDGWEDQTDGPPRLEMRSGDGDGERRGEKMEGKNENKESRVERVFGPHKKEARAERNIVGKQS